MRFITLLLLFSSVLAHAQTPERKVLFIGIDGCRWDALQVANTPAMDGLLSNAIYSSDGLCAYPTWSGNGWSSMLTGAWHTKHGVRDNTFSGSNYGNYPDFITRMEEYDSTFQTYSCVHWAPINNTIVQNADVEVTNGTDAGVAAAAIDALNNHDPDLLFVAFDDVDHAGHLFGFSPSITDYTQVIEATDVHIANILDALYSRPNYANEDWLIIVTTDHGGNPSGHGGGTIEERTIFTVYSNPAFTTQLLEPTPIIQLQSYTEASLPQQTYAQPSNQTPFNFGASQDFTIEFWVKANSAFSGDPTLISNKDWDSGLNPGFVISAQAGKFWKVNVGDGTDRIDIQGGELDVNLWHHIAVSFDRDGLMTAYEDGALVGMERMQNIGDINSGLPLVINQDGTTNYGFDFDGSYRDIRIWNAVLPNDVIVNNATHIVTSSHPYYANLLANWRCEEGSGSTFLDLSPNLNHCAVNNGLFWTANQFHGFTVYDYSPTPREPDNAVTALEWLCVPIDPAWNLDGKAWVNDCFTSITQTEIAPLTFTISPNPVKDVVQLSFSKPLESMNLSVFDIHGRLILSQHLDQVGEQYRFILPENSPKGIYLLQVETPDGQSTQRFVK